MKSTKFILIGIILLSIVLRTFQLNKVPPALFGDEIDVGYQAYSLLLTGRDIGNQFLPFYIKSLSEHRTPLYIYSAVPFVGIFGLNEWGVRLPAAFWGIVSIIGIYFLVKRLFGEKTALIAAFLLTISPWHLQYSRASFEVTELLSFLIFATYFFLKGLEKPKYFILSGLIFGLTPYIYSTALAFVPLWVLFLIATNYKQLLTKHFLTKQSLWVISTVIVVLITTLPMFYSLYTGEAKERFGIISIFQDSVLTDKLNIARKTQSYYTPDGNILKSNPTVDHIFSNRLFIFGQVFSQNYLESLSFDFLFTNGDPNFRQAIFEMGELYKFEIITILLGLGVLLLKLPIKSRFFVLGWLLLAPIPASLTQDGGYHATRLIIELIPLTILSAIGGVYLLENFKKHLFKLILVVVLILAIFNVTFYLHRYYVNYPVESWRWWHVGFKEAINYVHEREDKYDTVVINNTYEPSLIRYLFFTKFDPALFHKEFTTDKPTPNITPEISGFKFGDKLYFGSISITHGRKNEAIDRMMRKGILFMVSVRDDLDGEDLRTYEHTNFNILKTIVDPKGYPIFFIIEGT